MTKQEARQLDALKKRVAEILFFEWDPIGISQDRGAPRDEYARYAPSVIALATANMDSPEVIADSLERTADNHMESPCPRARCLEAARSVIAAINECPIGR